MLKKSNLRSRLTPTQLLQSFFAQNLVKLLLLWCTCVLLEIIFMVMIIVSWSRTNLVNVCRNENVIRAEFFIFGHPAANPLNSNFRLHILCIPLNLQVKICNKTNKKQLFVKNSPLFFWRLAAPQLVVNNNMGNLNILCFVIFTKLMSRYWYLDYSPSQRGLKGIKAIISGDYDSFFTLDLLTNSNLSVYFSLSHIRGFGT